jgi:hypothetical protein
MIFWHASLVGWIVCWKQGIEKTMKFAPAYETNVADLHGPIWCLWTWLPQGMSVRRILDGKLFAEDVVVGHRVLQKSRKLSREGDVTEVGYCRGCDDVLGCQVDAQHVCEAVQPTPKIALQQAPAASPD